MQNEPTDEEWERVYGPARKESIRLHGIEGSKRLYWQKDDNKARELLKKYNVTHYHELPDHEKSK